MCVLGDPGPLLPFLAFMDSAAGRAPLEDVRSWYACFGSVALLRILLVRRRLTLGVIAVTTGASFIFFRRETSAEFNLRFTLL